MNPHSDVEKALQVLLPSATDVEGLARAPSAAAAPTEAEARYAFLHKHAQGGMGEIWLVEDTTMGRRIALKRMKPEFASRHQLSPRFLAEAKITGQLEHPGIVPVYEVAEDIDPTKTFYTMRFVKGRTLSAAVQEFHAKRKAEDADAVNLFSLVQAFASVGNTIAFAHSRGVLHRDLKGQNVVLGEYGEVFVLDWGLAKVMRGEADRARGELGGQKSPVAVAEQSTAIEQPSCARSAEAAIAQSQPDEGAASFSAGTFAAGALPPFPESDLTQPGQVMGTPGYMSPEQARGDVNQIDARSDVYSLGAILYEVLTGQAPFAGLSAQDVVKEVQVHAPEPPHRLWKSVPRPLEAICLKALATKPVDRYAGADAMVHEVQRYLADERVLAYREPLGARLFRTMRKHRTKATALGILLMAAVVVLGVLLAWQRAEFRGERAALLYSADAKRDVEQQWNAVNFRQEGAFGKVSAYIDAKIKKLPDEAEYAEIRDWLTAKHDLARRLATAQDQFLREANDTWSYIGEERGAEARRACERALASFGALEHDAWWNEAPAAALTADQKKELQREAYRLLLMLSAMHVLQGMDVINKSWKVTPEAAAKARAGSRILDKARAMEKADLAPASTTAVYVDKWARKVSTLTDDELGAAIFAPLDDKHVFVVPESFTPEPDYYFLGFMHRFLGVHKTDAVTRVIHYFWPKDFDYATPLETAELLLRRSAVHDADDHWTWFILGRILMEKGDNASAQTAFERCISLRGDYSRGHEHRGLVLVQRALATEPGPVRAEYLRQAEADSRTAAALAPHDFSTHWVRGDMDRLLGNDAKAIDSYAHALMLVNQLQARISLRGKRLQDIDQLAKKVLKADAKSAAGLALRTLHDLAKADSRRDVAKAADDFVRLTAAAPEHVLSQLGLGQAWERLTGLSTAEAKADAAGKALDAYQAVLALAVKDEKTRWMHVEALKGRGRVCHALSRRTEADQAWQEARRLDPALPATLPTPTDEP